jgi:hypothetical protein
MNNKWENFCNRKEIKNGEILTLIIICLGAGFIWGNIILK